MDNDLRSLTWKKTRDTAAIFHIFYPDLYETIVEAAQSLGDSCDYYVTIPEDQIELIATISQQFPETRILPVQNRGRDILPFLEILERILPLNYDLLIKIHTKKTLHRADGTSWRQDVYHKLLGSSELVATIRNAFSEDSNLGILGAKGHVLDSRFYMGGNRRIVEDLITRTNLKTRQPLAFPFVASTMFWARPKVFTPLIDANITAEEFPEEPLPADGTMAHALERFFGLLAIEQGFTVKSIDSDGKIYDPDPQAIYQFAPVPKALALQQVKSIVYYPAYSEAYAIEHLRITAPFRGAGIELISGNPNGYHDPDRVLLGDAVIFQREFPQNVPLYDQIVAKAHQNNKLIFYELDDLLFDLPESHPERIQEAYNASLMPMMAAMTEADVVVVPTEELGNIVEGFNPNVIILPNYLDDSIWRIQTPKQTTPDEQLTIGYIGSNSHTPDLETIAPVLRNLLSKYQGNLKLEVWGTPLPEGLQDAENINWHPSPTNNYVNFVNFFQTCQFDLVIAPLANNLFNRCKSGLKFLEYSALGSPGVYSRLVPYEVMITDGVDGFLASTQDEWLKKIQLLLEDTDLRHKMALAAQKTVRENWLLSRNIQSWQDILEKLNRDFLLENSHKDLRTHITNTINRHLYQDRLNSNARFTNLQQDSGRQIQELQEEAEQQAKVYQEEIVSLQRDLQESNQHLNSILQSPKGKFVIAYRNGRKKLSQGAKKVMSVGPFRRIFSSRDLAYKDLLLGSGMFDTEYYLRLNPDVRNAGVDPVIHYLNHGGMEGRNPSEKFDSNWYLNNNPDVKAAQVNPLLHYLRFGKREGRTFHDVAEAADENRKVAKKSSDKIFTPEKFLLSSELKLLLTKKLLTTYEIALSHDDYLTVTGGTQALIADLQRKSNRKGNSFLHIYPYKKLLTLADENAPLYLGINLDGENLGETESGELVLALKELEDKQISKVSIHHSMGFNRRTIQAILDLAGNQGEFWLHDYFSLCPSYNLRRNDKEYCGAPDINSNSCRLCSYLENRRLQQPIFEQLFKDNHLEVLSPSQFTYELWQSRFPIQVPAHILPPARLNWKQPVFDRYQSGAINIGFLGYPLDYKGWDTWEKLNGRFEGDQRYRFYHFSTQAGTPGNYKQIETRVTDKNRLAMVEALKRNKIDVALLWSTAAETFSFTMHEAMAAGCFILTNPKSGNIQDYIHRNPVRGLVLDNDEQLLKLFEFGEVLEKVRAYQSGGKPQADLVFGSLEEVNK
ncbi:MAG: rhamnan synthesis F family protein [Anaerolineaceae bacterium]